jgi:micrococcal nuclease
MELNHTRHPFWQRLGGLLCAVGLGVFLLGLLWPATPLPGNVALAGQRTPCRVVRVFDGDTLSCDLNGNGRIEKPREYIRLLGIDAPESSHSTKNRTGQDQPGAHAAWKALERLTLGKTIYLSWDRRRRDRYGRSLAYVYERSTSQESVNEWLVRRGYCRTLFYKPNFREKSKLEQAERLAQQRRLGLWGNDAPRERSIPH